VIWFVRREAQSEKEKLTQEEVDRRGEEELARTAAAVPAEEGEHHRIAAAVLQQEELLLRLLPERLVRRPSCLRVLRGVHEGRKGGDGGTGQLVDFFSFV